MDRRALLILLAGAILLWHLAARDDAPAAPEQPARPNMPVVPRPSPPPRP